MLLFTGELRNCEGENGRDLMGVAPFGLLKDTSALTEKLAPKSPDFLFLPLLKIVGGVLNRVCITGDVIGINDPPSV